MMLPSQSGFRFGYPVSYLVGYVTDVLADLGSARRARLWRR
jgi:hypothetical protein